jgi:hypothetical protein
MLLSCHIPAHKFCRGRRSEASWGWCADCFATAGWKGAAHATWQAAHLNRVARRHINEPITPSLPSLHGFADTIDAVHAQSSNYLAAASPNQGQGSMVAVSGHHRRRLSRRENSLRVMDGEESDQGCTAVERKYDRRALRPAWPVFLDEIVLVLCVVVGTVQTSMCACPFKC